MASALVLFSGGQDSTVCLFWALKKFERVETVCFSYGQRHKTEIEAAKNIAHQSGVTFSVVDLSMIAGLSVNALTDESMVMDSEKPQNALPNAFVPGRNMLFISVAAVFAYERNISDIVIGVSQADYSGYPDCRQSFIRSINKTVNLAFDGQFVIHTPLMLMDKAAVWQLADKLNIFDLVRTKTVTCYNGISGDGCGNCPSCKLRKNGLDEYYSKVSSREAKT